MMLAGGGFDKFRRSPGIGNSGSEGIVEVGCRQRKKRNCLVVVKGVW